MKEYIGEEYSRKEHILPPISASIVAMISGGSILGVDI